MIKKSLLVILLSMAFSTMPMFAQQQGSEGFSERRLEVLERRVNRLADEFGLKDVAREDFKMLYKKYQKELMEVMKEGFQKSVESGRKRIDDLTSEEAAERVKNLFDRKAQEIVNFYNRLEIDKKYYKEFAKTLNNKQLLKIFDQGFGFRNQRDVRSRQGQQPMGGQDFNMPRGDFGEAEWR